MAYVPPHKRHPSEIKGRTLTPDSLKPKFKNSPNLRPLENFDYIDKVIYSSNAITRWISIGLDEDGQIPSSVRLQPLSVDAIQRSMGVETLELVKTSSDSGEGSQARSEHWLTIAENVLQDLVSSFEVVRNEIKGQILDLVPPALVVRLGCVLFHNRDPSKTIAVGCMPTMASLRYMKRIFYGHMVESYMDHIKREVIPNIGVVFLQEKSTYHVQLFDTSRPGSVISCKCGVAKGASTLELYKLELNRLRHLIVDISCLNKNLDLRLMLFSKRSMTMVTKEQRKSITNLAGSAIPDSNVTSTVFTEEEIKSITKLIRSAVIDGNVKGGIQWPLGRASTGDRFRVFRLLHATSKAYDGSSIRLKLRHADRFDYRTSEGEVSDEVVVKLKGVASALLEQKLEMVSISNMLKDELKMIWEHFLSN